MFKGECHGGEGGVKFGNTPSVYFLVEDVYNL